MDSLTVTISSPTHTPHTFTLSLGRQCSILELKEIIAARLDSKPTIADQRLIFGGYVLDDKDTLERVFEKVDCSHSPPTIHVVVSHRLHTSAPASPSPLRFRTNSESTTAITPPSPRVTGNMTTAATSGTNLNTHSFAPFANTAAHQGNRAESGTSSTHSAEPPLFAAGQLPAMSAPFYPAQSSSMQQPMQYVIVNGMPYLVPAASLPILHHQHCMQQAHHFSPYSYYGAFAVNAEGTPYFHHAPPAGMGDHAHVGTGPGQGAVAAVAADGNVQDNAARDQRRAASLWLLMKLAFGVYLFSQNGSIERIVLLHVAAFIIFL
ncbi:hypothetical protein BGZ58_001693 [Dissophora ornata]|nr:hypothetical protein BGZ58_001693 [Dissophora ornata]